MAKVLRTLVFSIFLSIILVIKNNFCYAGWPINICPGIEGRMLDATTGQPIENAIIKINYIKNQFAIADSVDKEFATRFVVTNKEGKYIVPSKISWHVISTFYTAKIEARHPLYETKTNSIRYTKDEIKTREDGSQYAIPGHWRYIGEVKNGKINYDFKLMSLEEKKSLPDSWEYFEWAKKIGIPINLDTIFENWDKLLEISDDKNKHHLEWLKNECRKAMQD